jgi:hypothetical protein
VIAVGPCACAPAIATTSTRRAASAATSIVMTRRSIACLMVVCACSVDPEAGMPFTSGAEGGATATPQDDDDTGGTEASSGDESGSADADADPSTTASVDESSGDASATITTTDAMTTTDASGSSDDGAASLDDGGSDSGAARGDAYQACTSNDDCTSDPGLACLTAENGGEGFCSPSCGAMGASPPDPQLCPDAPPGVTATVVCLEGFLIRNCALSCAGGLTCPDGTECLPANDGGGPYCFGSA